MKACLSQNTDKEIILSLEKNGFETVLIKSFQLLSAPVATHADMLFFFDGDTLFLHKDYKPEPCGFEHIVKVDEPMGETYPDDVLLNIALVGDLVFANTKFASKTVLCHLQEKGKQIVHVAQGYAHCSICRVSENAIITADKGIASAAIARGLDALLIGEGDIALPPYEYGFIGGASGSYRDTVYFAGSLSCHRDGEQIRAFCEKHKKNVVELANTPLRDIGGILFK